MEAEMPMARPVVRRPQQTIRAYIRSHLKKLGIGKGPAEWMTVARDRSAWAQGGARASLRRHSAEELGGAGDPEPGR
jgi:hypothetical protein